MNAITIHGWNRWRRVWWSISIWNWNFSHRRHCFCFCFRCCCFNASASAAIHVSKSSIMPQTTNLSFILSSVSWACAFALLFHRCSLAAYSVHIFPFSRFLMTCYVLFYSWQGYRFTIIVSVSSDTFAMFFLMNLIHWQQQSFVRIFSSLTVCHTISLCDRCRTGLKKNYSPTLHDASNNLQF